MEELLLESDGDVSQNPKYMELCRLAPSIPWYISSEEDYYLYGGVNYEEDAAKEQGRRRKRLLSVNGGSKVSH